MISHIYPPFPSLNKSTSTPQAGPKGGRAAVLRALVPSPETSPVALELDPWVMMRYPKRSKKMKGKNEQKLSFIWIFATVCLFPSWEGLKNLSDLHEEWL
jgi:hypothetical protein